MANPTPSCPRCGYDQRGAIAAWGEASCPIGGTCSECGLGFEWGDLLSPVRALTKLFEVDDRKRRRAFVWTCWYAMLCWPLWNRMRMHYPIRRGRIGWFVVLFAATLYGILAISGFMQGNVKSIADLVSYGTSSSFMTWCRDHLEFDGLAVIPLDTGWDRSALPVRFAWLIMFLLQWAFMPILFLLLPTTLRRAKVRRLHLLRGVGYSSVWMVTLLFCWGLGMRLGEWLFSWSGPFSYAINWYSYEKYAELVLAMAALLLSCVWWGVFAGRYLRLPHAGLIGLLLGVLSTLAAFLIMLVASRGYMIWNMA